MRILIFATTYVGDVTAMQQINRWIDVHGSINPDCDLYLVDSASPMPLPSRVPSHRFPDNIGHLARGGLDGWGRAFCYGLDRACADRYDYVAHIEGDSLFRLSVRDVATWMRHDGVQCASVPVCGTKRLERDWVETGLMVFSVSYLQDRRVTARYNWRDHTSKVRYPHTPEWYLHRIVRDELHMMPWSAERGDRGQIDVDDVGNYDWITHVHPEVLDAFARSL